MPAVIIESGALKGKRFELPAKGTVLIGRDPECSIPIDDPSVSPRHCLIKSERGSAVLVDTKKGNRTQVNGTAVDRHALQDGDTIHVGTIVLSFRASRPDPLIGSEMSGYRIEQRLARGSRGTVYLAVQASLNRRAVLRVYPPEFAGDPTFLRFFAQELRDAVKLNHPNVVTIYDAGKHGKFHFIAMEYLPGGSLEELLANEGPLPCEQAAAMALDALEALTYAEKEGIVHGGIKPGNLFIAADGSVKIRDLGLAVAVAPSKKKRNFRQVGSPAYLSPEQILGRGADHRSDTYALGATLYHAIAGCPPYAEYTGKALLRRKVLHDCEDLKSRVSGVSPSLAAVVSRMLAREPADRYQSAEEAREALEEVLHLTGRFSAIQNKKILLAGGGIIACLLLLLVLSLSGSSPEPDREISAVPKVNVVVEPRPTGTGTGEGSKEPAPGPLKKPVTREVIPPAWAAPLEYTEVKVRELVDRGDFKRAREYVAALRLGLPEEEGFRADELLALIARSAEASKANQVAKVEPTPRPSVEKIEPSELFPPPANVPPMGLTSYAAVESIVNAEQLLVPAGATWRYFRGTQQPSADWMGWTALDFDDSAWLAGPSGFGYGDGDDATILRDMKDWYTTLYIRHVFEVPDPSPFTRLVLSLRVDDGCVAFINGQEIGRVLAGASGFGIRFDARAIWEASEPVEEIAFTADTPLLRRGKNVLAILGLNCSKGSSDFTLLPVLKAVATPVYERDKKRLAAYDVRATSEVQENHMAYFEGRWLQRNGKHKEAAEEFQKILAADKEDPEPYLRLVETLGALGDHEAAARCLTDALAVPMLDRRDFWDRWFSVAAVGLRLDSGALLKALDGLPKDTSDGTDPGAWSRRGRAVPPGPDTTYESNVRWVLQELRRSGGIKIDCGNKENKSPRGPGWANDCFYSASTSANSRVPVSNFRDASVIETYRWFHEREYDSPPYRIPLPCGDYHVVLRFAELHFTEPHQRVFGLIIEGKRVMDYIDPFLAGAGCAQRLAVPVTVEDAWLDIRGIYRSDRAQLCGLEIYRGTKRDRAPRSLATITILSNGALLRKGETLQLFVTGYGKDGIVTEADSFFQYDSDDTSVAGVSPTGLVTALKKGNTTITARGGGAECKVPIVVGDFIDLGAIAAGGNGVDKAPAAGTIGINQDTGEWVNTHIDKAIANTGANPQPVPASDLIDSVFLITQDRQVIHTGGLEYQFGEGDGSGSSWNCILNGHGRDPDRRDPLYFSATGPVRRGVGIHASAGITYNLDTMRALFGEDRVKHFFTFAGEYGGEIPKWGRANCYIIASDDAAVLQEWEVLAARNRGEVRTGPLPKNAKYLTVAVGAANNGEWEDRGCFAGAVITADPIFRYYEIAFSRESQEIPRFVPTQCHVFGKTLPYGWVFDVTDEVSFSSSNTQRAKVSKGGMVTGFTRGKVDITASLKGCVDASMRVQVIPSR